MWDETSSVTVENSVIWDEALAFASGDDAIQVSHSNIRGGWPGLGNIDADPLFAFPTNPRLTAGSPCIDSGSHDVLPELDSTDLDGTVLPVDGDGDGQALLDMGAYEYVPAHGTIALSAEAVEFFLPEDESGVVQNRSNCATPHRAY